MVTGIKRDAIDAESLSGSCLCCESFARQSKYQHSLSQMTVQHAFPIEDRVCSRCEAENMSIHDENKGKNNFRNVQPLNICRISYVCIFNFLKHPHVACIHVHVYTDACCTCTRTCSGYIYAQRIFHKMSSKFYHTGRLI